ncbi:MAG: TolB family protein, partial [Terriglobales bacterium]
IESGAGSGPSLALSPDGTPIVYVAERAGVTQLHLRGIGDFEARPIAGTEGGFAPFFSPDGQWIAFFYGISGQLRKVPLAGGPVMRLCDAQAPFGATWAEDGNIYFASRWYGESLLRVPSAGGKPEKITTPDTKRGESSHRWPHTLPGGRALLFAIGSGSSYDDARIALLDLKTGQWRTLVEGGTNPAYVPTGHIVYARAGTLLAIAFDLQKLEVTGTPVPILEGVATSTANGEAQFSVAAKGTLAYVPGGTGQSARRLVWLDRAGKAQPVTEHRRAYEDLDLSPDGKKVALTIEGPAWNIWIYDLERGTLTRLTHELTNTDPLWTLDGKRIVYTSFRDGQYGLFWRPADGSGPEEQLHSGPYFLHAYSWSADGRLLAFNEQHPQTQGDNWVMPFQGQRKPQPFLRTSFNEWFPALSPDGRWIAYTSDESGQEEVYVQPYPGPGGKVQISTGGGGRAIWARGGRELFYRAGDKLMAVDVETQPAFRAGKPRLLFESRLIDSGHFYDPTPDARRFVAIQPGEETSPRQVHVVLHWFEELKHRAAAK